jgi:hypothetical protein
MLLPSFLTNIVSRAFRSKAPPATPSLEFHIPISPTPVFLNMLRCFALSLRRNGGVYKDAPVVVTAGAERIDSTLEARNPWLAALGIDLHWVSEDEVRTHSWFAQVNARFRREYRSDMVVQCDADLLVAAPFDDAVRAAHADGAFAGMIAMASPLQFFAKPPTWDELYATCGIAKRPDPRHEHVSWPRYFSPDAAYQKSPPYFNFGFTLAPASVWQSIADRYQSLVERLHAIEFNDLHAQTALGMALDEAGVPLHLLPPRYNFSNSNLLDSVPKRELASARILHIHSRAPHDKNSIFRDAASIRAFTRLTDLIGVDRIAQRILRSIEPDLESGGPTRASA